MVCTNLSLASIIISTSVFSHYTSLAICKPISFRSLCTHLWFPSALLITVCCVDYKTVLQKWLELNQLVTCVACNPFVASVIFMWSCWLINFESTLLCIHFLAWVMKMNCAMRLRLVRKGQFPYIFANRIIHIYPLLNNYVDVAYVLLDFLEEAWY